MPFTSARELVETLSQMRLVAPRQLDDCVRDVGVNGSPEELLNALQKRSLLSSYQFGKLAKGEVEGLILGDFKLLYRNASGSFARVFRACRLSDDSMVGIKLLRQRWANDPQVVQQFHREAKLGRQLDHPNIVPIYDVGQDGDQHFLSMEFVEGGNLRDFMRIRKKLSPVEATRCALEISEGLHYALTRGMTHRDLKMTNVLMSSQGVAKLVDFGLAGIEGRAGSGAGESIQRALEYATIEKATDAPDHDPRSDLYFLGAMFYELLSGVAPFPPSKSRVERKQLSRYRDVRPLEQVEPELPRILVEIVGRLMKLDPSQRYQRASDVIVDLKAAQGALDVGSDGEGSKARRQATVMCIEQRTKQQDILRDYFTKRGFRTLVLTDMQRGLNRLKASPPDCLVLMGESLGDDVLDGFNAAVNLSHDVVVIGVLNDDQAQQVDRLKQSDRAVALVQPITLRKLREVISEALVAIGKGDVIG